jgi:hypothetical protein
MKITAATVNAEFRRRGFEERVRQEKDHVRFVGGDAAVWETSVVCIYRVGEWSVACWVDELFSRRTAAEIRAAARDRVAGERLTIGRRAK